MKLLLNQLEASAADLPHNAHGLAGQVVRDDAAHGDIRELVAVGAGGADEAECGGIFHGTVIGAVVAGIAVVDLHAV